MYCTQSHRRNTKGRIDKLEKRKTWKRTLIHGLVVVLVVVLLLPVLFTLKRPCLRPLSPRIPISLPSTFCHRLLSCLQDPLHLNRAFSLVTMDQERMAISLCVGHEDRTGYGFLMQGKRLQPGEEEQKRQSPF
jgi:hypothetical protein